MPNERQEYFLVELENEDGSKRESESFDSVAIGFNQCLQEILYLEKEKD